MNQTEKSRARDQAPRPGPRSIYRSRAGAPFSVRLVPDLETKLKRASKRLKLSKADVVKRLIDLHASTLTHPDADRLDCARG
jgi:hypothetical protein